MSCNGCRVLRKGCSETCVLRTCLQCIDTAEAQGHATLFVAKFFGRAGLMNFISSVPDSQKPAMFQSLLFEACGRTINPVTGAVGMLWQGRWDECQAAVDAVLRGGTLQAQAKSTVSEGETTEAEVHCRSRLTRRRREDEATAGFGGLDCQGLSSSSRPRRPESPSEGSVTTSAGSGGEVAAMAISPVLLNLFY